MPKDGVWTGCGHKVRPLFYCHNIRCTMDVMTVYMEFRNDNPRDLCYECWKENGRDFDGR